VRVDSTNPHFISLLTQLRYVNLLSTARFSQLLQAPHDAARSLLVALELLDRPVALLDHRVDNAIVERAPLVQPSDGPNQIHALPNAETSCETGVCFLNFHESL